MEEHPQIRYRSDASRPCSGLCLARPRRALAKYKNKLVDEYWWFRNGGETKTFKRKWHCGMKEGDDHLDMLSRWYVQSWAEIFGGKDAARQVIGSSMVAASVIMGMELEPQGPGGVVHHSEYYRHSDRIEFVSRIFCVERSDDGAIRCHGSFPKVRKTFRAACVTFDKEKSWVTAATCKWLAIMRNTLSDLRQFNFYYMLTRWANQVAKDHQIRVTFDPGHKEWWQRGLYHHFIEDCGIDVDNTDFDALIDRVVAEGQQRCEQQSLCAGWCAREVGIDLDTYFHQATHFEQIAKCDEIDAAEVAGAVLAFASSLPSV